MLCQVGHRRLLGRCGGNGGGAPSPEVRSGSLRCSFHTNRTTMLGRWTCRHHACVRMAAPLSPTHSRHSSTHVPGRTLRGGDLGPTRSHDHQTFRARKDGTATALPLPPLLDPVVVEERAQWEKPKERAKHVTLTPFQRQLWENSFGMLCARDATVETG